MKHIALASTFYLSLNLFNPDVKVTFNIWIRNYRLTINRHIQVMESFSTGSQQALCDS